MQTFTYNPQKHNTVIKHTTCIYNNIKYNILNYDPNYMCFDVPIETTQCRSVIFSSTHKLLSISPRKSTQTASFCKKYNLTDRHIYINEYIDGTLIHLFYDPRIRSWEIATKCSVGGNQILFNKSTGKSSNLTVRQMFMDALVRDEHAELSDLDILKDMPHNICLSLVLLHPNNLILFPENTPKIYVTNACIINSKHGTAQNIPLSELQTEDFIQHIPTLLFPETRIFSNWNDLIHQRELNMGYVATHTETGERCTFHNKQYREIKCLSNYEPVHLYTFLCAKRMDLTQTYASMIPSFRKTFAQFQKNLNQFVNCLHTTYLTKYVWKNFDTQFKIDTKYSQYVDILHKEVYIPSLSTTEKVIITKPVIRKFLLTRPPIEIISLFYHHFRRWCV